MKAIDIIKPRHELFEVKKLPGAAGFAVDAYQLAVQGIKQLLRLAPGLTREEKAFIEQYAQQYAEYVSKQKMTGKTADDVSTWFTRQMSRDPTIAPKIKEIGKDGKETGKWVDNPDYGKPTELELSPFARDPKVQKEIVKQGNKLAPKVHKANLEKISAARTEKTIEAIKEKYSVLRGGWALLGLANFLAGAWPMYEYWATTRANIQSFKDLGTTQNDYNAQLRAAGFDPGNLTAEAQDWIATKLKPSTENDMATWVDRQNTINNQRLKTQCYAIGATAALGITAGVKFINFIKYIKLERTAAVLSDLLVAGGIVLFGEFVKEVNDRGISKQFGQLLGKELEVTAEIDNVTGKQVGPSTHDTAVKSTIGQTYDLSTDSLPNIIDRTIKDVLALPRFANYLRKKVGNTIAGNDTEPPAAPAQPAAPTPAQPAPGAADDKKSTTPADQPAPSDKPKVDANGVKQGEMGYTTASGWTIEHVLPDSIVWGNPKEGEKGKHVQLPKGQEP